MLEPNDRRLFLESLRPPLGYALARAIGTTFTLDLRALLAAPLAFSLFDWVGEDGAPRADPLALLEAIRRQADKIHVFCQEGQIGVPGPNRPLLTYLEGSVIAVRAPRGGLFHPKVWVLRFEPIDAGAEPVRYRLLVMSRNLTFDRAWDTLLVLDGELVDRTNAIRMSRPLGDFVRALPAMATRELSKDLTAAIDQIQDELRRVRFELPPNVEKLAFHPLGIEGAGRWPFTPRIDRMLVISPFVSNELLTRLADLGSHHVLVSRVDSLAEMKAETLERFDSVHVLSDAAFFAVDEGAGEGAEGEGDAHVVARDPLVGLHAKVYVADAGWDARLWLGSANATDGAFGDNVEFLVELIGKKSRCGIDAVLGAEDGGACLRALLQPYEAGPSKPPDPVEEGLRAAVATAREAVSHAAFAARVQAGTPGRYTLAIHPWVGAGLELPEGVALRCWPVTLGEGFAALSVAPYAAGTNAPVAAFYDLAVQELTSFVAFLVTATKGQRTFEERFVLNLPLDGAPADRREALLKALIKDPTALIRYLMLLLAEAGTDPGALGGGLAGEPGGAGQDGASGPLSGALFESLLRALERDPRRIDDVERLVADLSKTADGEALLPPGFDEIWLPILTARKELSR